MSAAGPGDRKRGSTPLFARAPVWLALALRVLALFVASELSGSIHAALDIAASLAGEQHVEDDCDDTDAGHECPPGCPNCHAGHAALAAPPRIADVTCSLRLSSVAEAELAIDVATRTPKHPELGSLYRPPRVGTLNT